MKNTCFPKLKPRSNTSPFSIKQKLISLSSFSFIHIYFLFSSLSLVRGNVGQVSFLLCSVPCLVSSLQEQLRRLYPRLKALAFGAKPESTLHTYLPSFLSRATPNCPDDMKREVAPPRRCSLEPRGLQHINLIIIVSSPPLLSLFQLLSSMTQCLCVDVQSLGVWRQLYTKHLSQSR